MVSQNMVVLFGFGLAFSFIGTLPLSTINLSILRLALQNHHQKALSFSYAASIVEFFQLGMTLPFMNILATIPHLKQGFALFSIPILLFLGYKSYKSHVNAENTEGGKIAENDGFKQGLVVACANVMVYPFWLLWGNVFVDNGILKTDALSLSVFCVGASIGTFAAFVGFVYLGKLLWKRLHRFQFVINRVIAYTFFGFALLQFYTFLK